MPSVSQIVTVGASADFHSLCGDVSDSAWHSVTMTEGDKNGGPNFLRAWREFRQMTQQELADAIGTNANMIGYLESGERGLSAKWLRKLSGPLKTTPGHLLEHDPGSLPTDIFEIWVHADAKQRRQLVDVTRAIVKDGTDR